MLSRVSEKTTLRIKIALVASWMIFTASLIFSWFPEDHALLINNGFWALVGLLPVIVMFAGHEAWRRICPISFVSTLPQVFRKWIKPNSSETIRKPKDGGWLERHHIVLQLSLLISFIVIRFCFATEDSFNLGLMIVALLGGAFSVGFIFDGKSWCNYFCPLSPVQSVFSATGGLLDSKSHLAAAPLRQSMCRKVGSPHDLPACVSCTKHCPDVDLEKSYWYRLTNADKRLMYYAYFGVVVAASYLLNRSDGNNGVKTSLLSWISVIAVAIGGSFASGLSMERILSFVTRKIERSNTGSKLKPITQHQTGLIFAWISINLFYRFIFPSSGLLSPLFVELTHIAVIILSSIWIVNNWSRSKDRYDFEVEAASSLKQKFDLSPWYEKESQIMTPVENIALTLEQRWILAKAVPFIRERERQDNFEKFAQKINNQNTIDSFEVQSILTSLADDMDLPLSSQFMNWQAQLHSQTDHGSWIRLKSFTNNILRLIQRQSRNGMTFEKLFEDARFMHLVHDLEKKHAISSDDLDRIKSIIGKNQERALAELQGLLVRFLFFSRALSKIKKSSNNHCSEGMLALMEVLREELVCLLISALQNMTLIGECHEIFECADILVYFGREEVSETVQRIKQNPIQSKIFLQCPALMMRISSGAANRNLSGHKGKTYQVVTEAVSALPDNETDVLWSLTESQNALVASLALFEVFTRSPNDAAQIAAHLKVKDISDWLLQDTLEYVLEQNAFLLRAVGQDYSFSYNGLQYVSAIEKTICLQRLAAFAHLDFQRLSVIAKSARFIQLNRKESVSIADYDRDLIHVVQGKIRPIQGAKNEAGGTEIKAVSDETIIAVINSREFRNHESFRGGFSYSVVGTLLERLTLTSAHIAPGTRLELHISDPSRHLAPLSAEIREIKEGVEFIVGSVSFPKVSRSLDIYTPVVCVFISLIDEKKYQFSTEICERVESDQKTMRLRWPKLIHRFERRNNERFCHVTACELILGGSAHSRSVWCTTIDISSGGLCVRLASEILQPNQMIDFRLLLETHFIKGKAKVGFVKTDSSGYSASLIFTENDQYKRTMIQKFIFKQIAKTNQTDEQSIQSQSAWDGSRKFIVSRKQVECHGTVSVYLKCESGEDCSDYLPGQFVTIGIDFYGLGRIYRCYSLSQSPQKDVYRITVRKKIASGAQNNGRDDGLMSTYINDHLQEGEQVWLKAPEGTFVLDMLSQKDVVLVAGGVGVTPLMAMLGWMSENTPNRRVYFFLGAKSSRDHIFRREIENILKNFARLTLRIFYSQPETEDRIGVDFDVTGGISVDHIKQLVPADSADFYICGPDAMMKSLSVELERWGVAKSRIHSEGFSAVNTNLASSSEGTGNVEFLGTSVKVPWNSQCRSLLELAEENSVDISSGCRRGTCGTCKAFLVEGSVKQCIGDEALVLKQGSILTCSYIPLGDIKLVKI
jgi:ferredoxin-NADP reductase